MRVAFTGSSGTGKTTLATFVAERYGLPINPIGARSVAASMGYASPYDVDKAGKRAEFQRQLVANKMGWEANRDAFVTDRTPFDNLAYTMLHDVRAIDAGLLAEVVIGTRAYTHIIKCPTDAFMHTGDDPARVHDGTYQELYETVIDALLARYRVPVMVVTARSLEDRCTQVMRYLGGGR